MVVLLAPTSDKPSPPIKPTATTEKSIEGIKSYKIIQEKVTNIVIEIVPDNNTIYDEGQISEEISSIFGETIDVKIKIVDEIKREQSGKLRKIISKVPKNKV